MVIGITAVATMIAAGSGIVGAGTAGKTNKHQHGHGVQVLSTWHCPVLSFVESGDLDILALLASDPWPPSYWLLPY